MIFEGIIRIIVICLFATCAYYIKKSEECECVEIDKSRSKFILYFSYFQIIYLTLTIILGNSVGPIFLSYPALSIIPLFSMVGILVWAIFTIIHVNSMRKCKCKETHVQEIVYGFAIVEIFSWILITIALGNLGYTYFNLSNKERGLFDNSFRKSFKKSYENKLKGK
jgi:hypothetical protein